MRLALNYQRVDPTKGGAETYVVDLCRRLVRLGHSVDLYAESWADGALPDGVRPVRVESTGRTKLDRIWNFAERSEAALSNSEYDCTVGLINTWFHDVIIPQGGVHGGSLEANAKRFPAGWRRTLYTLAKRANPKFRVYEAIERRQYAQDRPRRVIAVSRMVQKDIQRFHHVPTHRIHVIPNAIDADRLRVDQPDAVRCRFRNEVGLRPDDLVGLFVGHNFWLKGLAPLMKAMARRKAEGQNQRVVKLVVCGGGRLGPFKRMAKSLGIEADVRPLGFYPDVRACFHGSDFFVSPTYYDPCSLVVFEALACGLPVITTACNGAGELMTDGAEGYVITSPDAEGELVAAIDRMVDPSSRALMSEKARALGQEQSMDRHVARLVKVFEEAAATKARWSYRPHPATVQGAGVAKESRRS